jgi:excisionase family DNA binding protein
MSTVQPLTAADLAHLLGVSLKTVHNWERDGRLTATRTLGGHLRFRPEDVRTDYERARLELPDAFLDYLKAPTTRARGMSQVRRIPTDLLRAELARREAQGAA